MASISGLSTLGHKLSQLAQQLIQCLRTLLTSLSIKSEQALASIKSTLRWSVLAFQAMLSKALKTLKGALLKSMLTVRQATAVNVTLWPVPDSNSYTLSFYRLRGINGVSSGIGTTADVPPRFVPCLAAGLAYYIAMKKPEVAARVAPLKQEYEFQFELAAAEDRLITDDPGVFFKYGKA